MRLPCKEDTLSTNNWLLTTGVNDECIMKWRLEVEHVSQDKDYKNYIT